MMTAKTKQGLKTIELALLLGILGDGLLRARPWGLNIVLWMGALVIALLVLLGNNRRRTLAGGGHWMLLTAVLFATTFAWRDSRALNALAGLCMLTALAMFSWRARDGRVWLASVTEYVVGAVLAGFNTFVLGAPLLFREVNWSTLPHARLSGHSKAIFRGLIFAVPLLVLFGALFASADATFERLFARLFTANHEDILGHAVIAAIIAWLAAGFLRGCLFGNDVRLNDGRVVFANFDQSGIDSIQAAATDGVQKPNTPQFMSLGIVEIGITLGLLNLLFLTFVLLQLRYFFGGAALVHESETLTYAEYYRRGFFELVTVASLVLPILLGAHWLLDKKSAASERIFRLFAGMQVMLVFVIMASALRRMMLYQGEYGLTEQRLYTTAFIAWLAIVFVWFALTVLRSRREQFACGALVAGFLVVAALHVVNPDALIVRVNIAHAQAGRPVDVYYLASLSSDAVPTLMQSIPLLEAKDRRSIIEAKVRGSAPSDNRADWRAWNWSRARARDAVRGNMRYLREIIDSSRDNLQSSMLNSIILKR